MADPTQAPAKTESVAEGFLGSVLKYSFSTFVGIGLYGLSMLLTGLFVPETLFSQVSIFTSWTNTIMTIAALGMDQSLIRFYHEPPKGLSRNGLFRACFYFSSAVLLVGAALGSTLFSGAIYSALDFKMVGTWVIPLLFLSAFFYLVARYFNVLYRMEGNIKVYTIETILMQFFYKLFFVLGAFLGFENPVPAMILCSAGGLGAFALVFSFIRRDALRPRHGELQRKNYKAILPYGLASAPTAIMLTANYAVSQSIISSALGSAGIYAYAYALSNVVATIQGGFASFWGPYMFANYKTEQQRIKRVHDYLNLIILVFFALLVAFEDILFFIFRKYVDAQPIFPLMMLSAVFTILCETTVYGNAIARRPIYDTIGFGLSFLVNIGLLVLLLEPLGLHGAAVALAVANFAMYLFRTLMAQRLYRSIEKPGKTALALALATLLAIGGTVFAYQFWLKATLCAVVAGIYCLMYKTELIRLVNLAFTMLKNILRHSKT